MFLKEADLLSFSFKQFVYKLKAHSNLLYGLMLIQIIALFFSIGGVSHMSSSNGELSVSVNTYSASLVIGFSFIWIFFIGILLTTKQYKKIELPLVTSSLSGNLSDIGFLMIASIFGGITSTLVGVLQRIILYIFFDRSQIIFDKFLISFYDLMLGIVIGTLYMILISALGYLIGSITKLSMAFVLIIPAIIFGFLRVYTDFFQKVLLVYTKEAALPLFALKVLITVIILFGVSSLLSPNKEVSQ
ncbi:hypothetical protein [Desulfosporosinus sp.]|uniref:hypothetical protein n=1 Tax=Desulfosporosinus sp. TaxID=157907 RepID=UPI0025C6959D|nr:hypothetical protein [Desulfosporosinus sp.]MBC2728179.1 hypothetical protein [Desulfosporosinus sp.]